MRNQKRSRVQNSKPQNQPGPEELPGNNGVQQANPLIINVIVRTVLSFLDLHNMLKFRGVNRLWNQEAIGLLRETKTPLFHLTLDNKLYIDQGKYVKICINKRKRTLLDLNKTVGLAGTGKWPPISLCLPQELNLQNREIRENLLEIFQNHATDLIKLTVRNCSESCEELVPVGTLLPLTNLKLVFKSSKISDITTKFLAACTKLQKFELSEVGILTIGGRLEGPDLQLPVSLTKLKISLEYDSSNILALTRKHLPNLTKLSLRIKSVVLEKGVFYKLLHKFRSTLKCLHINGGLYWERNTQVPRVTYRFPVMEKLEELKYNRFWQTLEPDVVNLSLYLPKLKILQLVDLPERCINPWLSGPNLESVTSLRINWAYKHRDTRITFVNTDKDMVTRIKENFPNLVTLTLTLDPDDASALYTVFESMQQLENLTVLWERFGVEFGDWTSVLFGVSKPIARSMANLEMRAKHIQNVNPTLRSLTKLKRFCTASTNYIPGVSGVRCAYGKGIPDALFARAFSKLINLDCLCLGERLMPSEAVAARFRSKGGHLKIYKGKPFK